MNYQENQNQNLTQGMEIPGQNGVPFYQKTQEEDHEGMTSSHYVNGVYMSKYVHTDENGALVHDKGPTFKELMEKREAEDNKPSIVAKKMYKNAIAEIKTSDNQTMDIDTAVQYAMEHGFKGANVGRSRSGRLILRSNPTDLASLSLRNLPTYE